MRWRGWSFGDPSKADLLPTNFHGVGGRTFLALIDDIALIIEADTVRRRDKSVMGSYYNFSAMLAEHMQRSSINTPARVALIPINMT